MDEKELREHIQRGIEQEAAALEQSLEGKEELADIEMPEGSFDDLMARIHANETAKKVKPFRMRKRALLAVALVAILAVGATLSTTGAKLFVPKVENRGEDGELNYAINNDEGVIVELTEDDAYEEIEEQLGILALRLTSKPKGMELEKVYIDVDMGEAMMEFYYGEHILTVYESKRSEGALFNTSLDGIETEEVDEVEIFHLGMTVPVVEIDKGDGDFFYSMQLKYANAYYYVTSDMSVEEFKNILMGIVFDTM